MYTFIQEYAYWMDKHFPTTRGVQNVARQRSASRPWECELATCR